jgi:hypothetical protein
MPISDRGFLLRLFRGGGPGRQSTRGSRKERDMKKTTKTLPLLISSAFLLFALGCEKQEGPAEKAGKEIDQGLDKTGEQMEKAGEKLKDKAEGE